MEPTVFLPREDQPIAGGRGVDRLGERAQADLAPLELLDGLDQLPDRAGEPVELPDDQRVPSPVVVERRLELGPIALRTQGRRMSCPPASADPPGMKPGPFSS